MSHFNDELLSAWLDGELSDEERAAVENRLKENVGQETLRELEQISELVKNQPAAQAPPGLVDSVMARIANVQHEPGLQNGSSAEHSVKADRPLNGQVASEPQITASVVSPKLSASPASSQAGNSGGARWIAALGGMVTVALLCFVAFLLPPAGQEATMSSSESAPHSAVEENIASSELRSGHTGGEREESRSRDESSLSATETAEAVTADAAESGFGGAGFFGGLDDTQAIALLEIPADFESPLAMRSAPFRKRNGFAEKRAEGMVAPGAVASEPEMDSDAGSAPDAPSAMAAPGAAVADMEAAPKPEVTRDPGNRKARGFPRTAAMTEDAPKELMEEQPTEGAAVATNSAAAEAPSDRLVTDSTNGDEKSELKFDHRDVEMARIGDVIPGLRVSGDKVAVVNLTVVDRKKGLAALQVLLAEEKITPDPAVQIDAVDSEFTARAEESGTPESGEVADKRTSGPQLLAVFVEADEQQIAAALNQIQQRQEFESVQQQTPVSIADLNLHYRERGTQNEKAPQYRSLLPTAAKPSELREHIAGAGKDMVADPSAPRELSSAEGRPSAGETKGGELTAKADGSRFAHRQYSMTVPPRNLRRSGTADSSAKTVYAKPDAEAPEEQKQARSRMLVLFVLSDTAAP